MKNSSPVTRHSLFKDEQGFVLVVALLALLVVTVLGVLALSTSTTEVMMSGNQRLREINFAAADSGIAMTEPVVLDPDRDKYNFLNVAQEQNLRDEIYCNSIMNTDTQNFSISIGDRNLTIDVDLVNVAEPGMGYSLEEGGPPIVLKNYVLNSTSSAVLGSEARLGAVYYIVGYCE